MFPDVEETSTKVQRNFLVIHDFENFSLIIRTFQENDQSESSKNSHASKINRIVFPEIYGQQKDSYLSNVSVNLRNILISRVYDWPFSKLFLEIRRRFPEPWVMTSLH